MKTIKHGAWTWTSAIGLWYGTGPEGQRSVIARPLMTSPWWVICSEVDDSSVSFVHIFRGSAVAADEVAARGVQTSASMI